MGLDTTHDAWHGPYSSFFRWRRHVAKAAGWHEEGQGLDSTFREIDWSQITEDNLMGRWDRLPEDPLVVLIAHSDSEGELPLEALVPLAERLEGLAERMEDTEAREGGPYGRATYDGERAATLRFAEGLRKAAAAGEPVEFH